MEHNDSHTSTSPVPTFRVRALEIHSDYAWDFEWVRKTLAFMERRALNALILHRNDIVDNVVYPGRYFGADRRTYRNTVERYQDSFRTLYRYTPTRRSRPLQHRDYLLRVIEEARRRGIDVYLQNKELWFPDILLELHPEVWIHGTVCPTHPFWWEFVETKYTELLEDVPGLVGIITSPGTGESRVSIAANRCACDRCRVTTPRDWYRRLLDAMHGPIAHAGKRLVVRDFVFDAAAQGELAAAMETLSPNVVISLKNTPHDYYPTFPHNPRIGRVGEHAQWVEFDVMGQYFGWGLGISVMTDDLRARMRYGHARGVSGVILRTDWEGLEAHTAFHTPNLLSLYAGAALAVDLDTPAETIAGDWLEGEDLLRPDLDAASRRAAAAQAADAFGRSWEVIRRSLYLNDCVFSDSSLYPVSLEHAWWLAEEKNSLRNWDPSKADALSVADEAHVCALLEEKDEAVRLVARLADAVGELQDVLTDAAWRNLQWRVDVFRRYVYGFRTIAHACVLTKYLSDESVRARGPFADTATALWRARLGELRALADEFDDFAATTSLPHTVYLVLNPERLRALANDLEARRG